MWRTKVFLCEGSPRTSGEKKQYERDRLDGLDVYMMAKADINYVFDRYMDTKTELRSSTYTNYTYMYNKYVRKGFGKRRIADVKYSDVLLFYQSLIEKGFKPNFVEGIHRVLHPTFQMAVRDDIIRNHPAAGVMAEIKRHNRKHSAMKHA